MLSSCSASVSGWKIVEEAPGNTRHVVYEILVNLTNGSRSVCRPSKLSKSSEHSGTEPSNFTPPLMRVWKMQIRRRYREFSLLYSKIEQSLPGVAFPKKVVAAAPDSFSTHARRARLYMAPLDCRD
jgi:hypothetical protein